MAVPQKRNHRGGLVGLEPVAKQGPHVGRTRSLRGVDRAVPGSTQAASPTYVELCQVVRVRSTPPMSTGTATTPLSVPVACVAFFGTHQVGSPLPQPHQDAHQRAHQESVSAGHSVTLDPSSDARGADPAVPSDAPFARCRRIPRVGGCVAHGFAVGSWTTSRRMPSGSSKATA
jgi:hypothetical protein